VNLLSGYLISEVAILQHESNGKSAPSSFKDIADEVTFPGGFKGGMVTSAVSLILNWCVLSFSLMRAGEMLPSSSTEFISNLSSSGGLFNDTPSATAALFALFLTALVSTQSTANLSKIASGAVTLMFLSFGSLLFPGLMNMQNDVVTTLLTEGKNADWCSAVGSAGPIFVSTLVYQNIIPTVTKLLGFDRFKSRAAITIGSGMPLIMYVAWCFAVLGGGVVSGHDAGISSMIFEAFAVSSVGGSSIAGVMSLAEEFESLLNSNGANEDDGNGVTEMTLSVEHDPKEDTMSLPSVLLGVVPPLAAGIMFSKGDDFSAALEIAGSYASPLLYGILPVMLAWQYYKERGANIPGGIMGIAAVGISSAVFIGQNLSASLGSII